MNTVPAPVFQPAQVPGNELRGIVGRNVVDIASLHNQTRVTMVQTSRIVTIRQWRRSRGRCGVMPGRGLIIALICLAGALHPGPLHARPPVVISGRVTDLQRRPIPEALITVPALNESTVSDRGGMYCLVIRSKVRSGQGVVIRASREGFDYASRSIRLSPKARLRMNFRLVPLK
jgi:hypothetical protein